MSICRIGKENTGVCSPPCVVLEPRARSVGCARAAPGSRRRRNKQKTLSLRGFLWASGRCDRIGVKEGVKQDPACLLTKPLPGTFAALF